MSGPVAGAVGVYACAVCHQPVTRCTASACSFLGWVHLRSRLHRCTGRRLSVHARVKGSAA